VAIGAVAAASSSHLLENGLFGVSPLDPVAFVAAAVFLMTVATVAIILPTMVALKTDPGAALRHD
jgi:hypothetical protein